MDCCLAVMHQIHHEPHAFDTGHAPLRVEAASLLHPRHPDIRLYMPQIDEDLVPGNSQV